MHKLIGIIVVATFGVSSCAQENACDHMGHWEGELSHEGKFYPIKLDISCESDRHSVTLDLPEYLIYGSDTDVVYENNALTIRSHIFDEAELTLSEENNQLVGAFAGFRDVTSQARLTQSSNEPVKYVKEDLSFVSGEMQLAGTIIKPAEKGKFPTIVWSHGSGGDIRSTFYYAGRAHLMAQNGVASFIYDKRGYGDSVGEPAKNINESIDDALAAVNAVKLRADVDDSMIGVAGFSQGGWIAPAVAARSDDVDFVLVGATPGVTGGEQNIFSMASRMRRDDVSEEHIAAAEQFFEILYQFYETGQNRESALTAYEQAKLQPWFESKWAQNILSIPDDGFPEGQHPDFSPYSPDPMDSWRQVHVPVLSMWGENDIDVPVEESRSRIEKTLTEIANMNFRLEVYPRASHGMWLQREGDEWDYPRQETKAHRLMVDWTQSLQN